MWKWGASPFSFTLRSPNFCPYPSWWLDWILRHIFKSLWSPSHTQLLGSCVPWVVMEKEKNDNKKTSHPVRVEGCVRVGDSSTDKSTCQDCVLSKSPHHLFQGKRQVHKLLLWSAHIFHGTRRLTLTHTITIKCIDLSWRKADHKTVPLNFSGRPGCQEQVSFSFSHPLGFGQGSVVTNSVGELPTGDGNLKSQHPFRRCWKLSGKLL